jgi:ribosomal protein L35AE/L33A
MKRNIRVFVIFVLALQFGYANAEQPELGKYPKVFSADDYTVTMLRLGKDDSSVLIKVDGIDNQFDGQIYLHKKVCLNTSCANYRYETTEIPGKEKWGTIWSVRSWGNYDEVSFYPPGIDKKHGLYKDKRPDNFDSNGFYKEYLGQKALREKPVPEEHDQKHDHGEK